MSVQPRALLQGQCLCLHADVPPPPTFNCSALDPALADLLHLALTPQVELPQDNDPPAIHLNGAEIVTAQLEVGMWEEEGGLRNR
jgi:hypothetical protein